MSDARNPLFSVIVVCLDAENYIAEALDSVLGQSFDSFELIVVDGGSTDDTLAIVARRQERGDGRLRLHSGPDEGLYDAMNTGLAMVRGDYVVYLGADDRMVPDALAVVAEAIESFGRPEIVAGATEVIGAARPWREPARSYRTAYRLPKRAPATHQSVYVARDALKGVGGFDTTYAIAADYDAYLKLVASGAAECLLDAVLSEFRLGGVSSQSARATAEEYRAVRIAHGANPVLEWIAMCKAVLASAIVGAVRGVRRADRGRAA